MQKHGPVVAWIIDDTGFPKQGKHSVGVARQYCGQLGKSDNCQAAVVSSSVSTWNSSLPMAWRLYLPEVWCQDAERCQQAGVPKDVAFQTKPEIALEQIRQAMARPVPVGVVLADAGYGKGTPFRTALTEVGLRYVVGIESNATVWEPGQQPLPVPANARSGCAPKRLQRNANPSAHFGKAVGPRLAVVGLEGDRLAPGVKKFCAPDLPLSACVLRIAITSAPNHIRKSGS
jgi:SRSO17 transposase